MDHLNKEMMTKILQDLLNKSLLRHIVTPAGHGASARGGFVKNAFVAYVELDAEGREPLLYSLMC